MKKPLVAGNWKMHKGPSEAHKFLKNFIESVSKENQSHFLIFPPAVNLLVAQEFLAQTNTGWGAQNIAYEGEGAFTGENSPMVLKEMGATHCLIGHSERRSLFFEDDMILSRKVKAAQLYELTPIFCVGETLQQRQQGQTHSVVQAQLEKGLSAAEKGKDLIIAYEPVWAIGTGQVATPEQAEEVHQMIRNWMAEWSDQRTSEATPILYGGSVKPENARDLFAQKNIDGFLVGGASLKVDSFVSVYSNCL